MKTQKYLFIVSLVSFFLVGMLNTGPSVARPFGSFDMTGEFHTNSNRVYRIKRKRRSVRRRFIRKRARRSTRARARQVRRSRRIKYLRARRARIGQSYRAKRRRSARKQHPLQSGKRHMASITVPRPRQPGSVLPGRELGREGVTGDDLQAGAKNGTGADRPLPRLSRNEKKAIQRALSGAGYYKGAVDGLFGFRTRQAIRTYQGGTGQRETGKLSRRQLASLMHITPGNVRSTSTYLPGPDRYMETKSIRQKVDSKAGSGKVKNRKKSLQEPRLSRAEIMNKIRRKAGNPVSVRRGQVLVTASVGRPERDISTPVKKKRVLWGGSAGKKERKTVDYFHALGKTGRGESLWIIKCIERKQLRLYYWRDKQWWVRGKKGGPIGHKSYGRNGISKLAGRICTS